MTIPLHLTEISTFEWSENEKKRNKTTFFGGKFKTCGQIEV